MPEICFWSGNLEHLLWQNVSSTLNLEAESFCSVSGLTRLKTGFRRTHANGFHLPLYHNSGFRLRPLCCSEIFLMLFFSLLVVLGSEPRELTHAGQVLHHWAASWSPKLFSEHHSFVVCVWQHCRGHHTAEARKGSSPQGARHEETIFSFCLNP